MTDTLLVRLKPYDPRRGFVLRRFTYAGIRFQDERGWYRVERKVGEHLRAVRTVPVLVVVSQGIGHRPTLRTWIAHVRGEKLHKIYQPQSFPWIRDSAMTPSGVAGR